MRCSITSAAGAETGSPTRWRTSTVWSSFARSYTDSPSTSNGSGSPSAAAIDGRMSTERTVRSTISPRCSSGRLMMSGTLAMSPMFVSVIPRRRSFGLKLTPWSAVTTISDLS